MWSARLFTICFHSPIFLHPSCSLSLSTLLLTLSAGATLPPLLIVLQIKHAVTSGPLHLLLLLPGLLFPESKALSLTSFKFLFKCHLIINQLLREHLSHFLSFYYAWSFFIALITTRHFVYLFFFNFKYLFNPNVNIMKPGIFVCFCLLPGSCPLPSVCNSAWYLIDTQWILVDLLVEWMNKSLHLYPKWTLS